MHSKNNDQNAIEAIVLNRDIVRLDSELKERILGLSSFKDDKTLFEESKHLKEIINHLKRKLENLQALINRVPSQDEQNEMQAQFERHKKELQDNTSGLTNTLVKVRKEIAEKARRSLLTGGTQSLELRKRTVDQNTLKQNAAKTSDRLTDLVAKMNERVSHSEQTMDSLVHSSAILAETQSEFENQTTHIQTSNKLLSKYERRELTDKILVAAIFKILVNSSFMLPAAIPSEMAQEVKMIDHIRNLSDLLREGKEEESKRLLMRVPNLVTSADETGRSTIHFAAVGGCLSILQFCINTDNDLANQKDDMGWTPLMIACSAGRSVVARYLLTRSEVDVNQKNNNGQSCLHYAASKNHKEILSLLLENGAYVNASDKLGHTPLHRAASQGHDQIVNMLISHKDINVDARNSEGNTPLFMACEENREDSALALAFKGADIYGKNNDEKSPLDMVQTSSLRTKLKNAYEKASAMQH